MKATELRIGNYYAIAENDGIKYKQLKEIAKNDLDYFSGEDNISHAAKPIPLTEEWRKRSGFKDNWLRINDFGNELEWRERTKEIVIWGSDGATDGHNYRVKCEYVHTFQNLYFALTNTELEIK